MTNIELLTQIMDFGTPMKQMVIMDAIEKHCRLIVETQEQPEGWPGMISWEAWKSAAQQILDELKEQRG